MVFFDVFVSCRLPFMPSWNMANLFFLRLSIPVSVFLSVFLPAFLFRIARLSYSAERCSHACPYQSLFVFTVHVHTYIHVSECIQRSSCLPIPVLANCMWCVTACSRAFKHARMHVIYFSESGAESSDTDVSLVIEVNSCMCAIKCVCMWCLYRSVCLSVCLSVCRTLSLSLWLSACMYI